MSEQSECPSQKNRVKYQHYVPHFYLEKFVNSDGQLWVYDKYLDKAYFGNPIRIGGEHYFYDIPDFEKEVGIDQCLEKAFVPLEGAAADVLKRWLLKLECHSYFRIYEGERKLFSLFLAAQILRTPGHRRWALQIGASLHKLMFREVLRAKFPELEGFDFDVEWRKEQEPYVHAETIIDSLTEFASILHDHIWIVARNYTPETFYTSDNPVSRKAHKKGGPLHSFSGIGSHGIQLMLPLSPQFSLSLLERGYWTRFQKLDGKSWSEGVNGSNVEFENALQVSGSTRFIYCQQNSFDLARKICRENPKFRDPTRMLINTF